jgi:hypothetical protein
MQFQQAPTNMRSTARSSPDTMMPASVEPTTKEIPYDYVAKFTLQGKLGNRVQDVINISVEGAFVAVAIGYSLIPAKLPDRTLQLDPLRKIWTGLFNRVSALVPFTDDIFIDPRLPIQCLLVRLCGIDFKYSIIDSGSGRELQNQPIHNIAGLGESNGDRPFRPLAKPMIFMPRSTVRIEIEEISEGFLYGYDDPQTRQRVGAQLYFVLHGYKMLGYGTALP